MLMQTQIACAQEQVNQLFRKHKKFIEKELTHCINSLVVQRKQNPSKLPDYFQQHTSRLESLRDQYASLLA